MDKIELQILGISSGHTSTSYTLIMEEKNGKRKLPIIIGTFEAQAIAIEIEKIIPVRPMTHDLFLKMAESFDLKVVEVFIHRLQDGVFYSNIIVNGNGQTIEIDARTSDAIAIALRFKCPIFTYESIMKDAGMIINEGETNDGEGNDLGEEDNLDLITQSKSTKDELANYTVEELEGMLEEAIELENYVAAAKIRDELNNRKT
jgi:bifunctional DNase/RNase